MSAECHYVCQRAANAIVSQVGNYQVSANALLGINQFLDEFLIQLLVDCQSLDLSRIKASVFRLIPSTLGKNAIVEAELELKTFTETQVIDYDTYERMKTLGQSHVFPTKSCFSLLRTKCLEYCTLTDQPRWRTSTRHDLIVISPMVTIYVTTVLEYMAEYILTTVAMTAETEETDCVRVKELFLALVDDLQLGMVFESMDLRDKMEKRVFVGGSRPSRFAPCFTPTTPQGRFGGSSCSANTSDSYLGMSFDGLDFSHVDDDDLIFSHHRLGAHTSISNYYVTANNSKPSVSIMTKNSSNDGSSSSSSKKAFKVFKNDYQGDTSTLSFETTSGYDPDFSLMNFDDLIRSGNTMRVSLTPNRLKSIEIKDERVDPAVFKSAWKRRSSSVPRMSSYSRSPATSYQRSPSILASSITTKTGNGYASTLYDVDLKEYARAQQSLSSSRESRKSESKLIEATSRTATLDDTAKDTALVAEALPTPTSSTPWTDTSLLYPTITEPPQPTGSTLKLTSPSSGVSSPGPVTRRSSLGNRKSVRRKREKVDESPNQAETTSNDNQSEHTTPEQVSKTTIYQQTPTCESFETGETNGSLQQATSKSDHVPDCDMVDSPITSTPTRITAGTVGTTIRQWDQVVKKSSSTSIHRKATTPIHRADKGALTTTIQAASRKSMVLDKVLLFERAYSVDNNRRASCYMSRRERFLYVQGDTPHRPVARTSAVIAAAAARFEAGESVAIQVKNNLEPVGDEQKEQENSVVDWLLG